VLASSVESDSALHAFSGADSPAASPFGSDERGEVLFSGASSRQSKAIVAFTLLPPARQRAAPPPPPPRPLFLSHVPASSWRSDVMSRHQYGPGLPSELSPPSCRETCTLRRSVFMSGHHSPPPLLLATTMSRVSCPSSLSCPMSSRAPDASCRRAYRAPSASAPGPTLVRVTALFRPIHPHFEIDGGHVGTPEPLFQGGSGEPLASASPPPCRSASWFEHSLIFRGDVTSATRGAVRLSRPGRRGFPLTPRPPPAQRSPSAP